MEFKKSFISNESNNKNVQHTTELIKRPVEEDKKETVYEDKDIRVSPDQSPINLQVAGITEHVQAQDLTHKALEGLRAIDEIEEDIAEYSEQSNTSMNSFSKFDNRDLFPHSIDEEGEGFEDNVIPEEIHFTNGHNANQVLESKVIGNDSDNNRSGKEEHINELSDVCKYNQIKTRQSDTEEDDCIPENISPEISQSTTTTYQIQNECILQTFESKLVLAADNNTPMKSFIPKRTNIVRSISRNSVQSVTKTIRSISRQSVDSQSLKLTSSGGVIMPSQQDSEQSNAKRQESVTDTYQSNLTLHNYDTLHKESLEQISEIKSTSSDSTKLKANIKSSKTPLESKRIAPAAEPNQETEALKPWDIQEGHQLFQSYLSETDRLSLGPPADESDEELKQSMQERILARLEGYNM
ncbi:hypothetical protein BC833DRAFT_215647 [Globomyces pollinis-pini]|nr:hypothetical protein BC833DRAFT_215647 [Globomyces pollinis-pini]